MKLSLQNYLPFPPLFLFFLLVAFIALVALVEMNVLSYAYEKMGVGRRYILAILLFSLVGSTINIPIAEFPAKDVVVNRVVTYYGMRYNVPSVEHRDRSILAVNLGGAVIPVALSIYLLIQNQLFVRGFVGIAIVAAMTHLIASPVPGLGIAMPILLPPIIAATVAMLLDHKRAAPLAYIAGSVGTLLGADVFNLHLLQDLGAPVASIGGAGISDGVFLTGIIAVLLA